MAGAGVTTGGVARHLGVSPTTVRSWERRYGIGPERREPGHHRRWSPQDVAVLEEMCRLTARGVPPGEAARQALGTARPPVVGPPGFTPSGVGESGDFADDSADDEAAGEAAGEAATAGTGPAGPTAPAGESVRRAPGGSSSLPVGPVRPKCRGLARAAVRLDSTEVALILRRAVADLGAVAAWTEVMMPALRAAGRKWAAEGERYVEVEHLLSWHVSTALRGIADRPGPVRAGRPALLAGMPAELHVLPLEAVAAGLAERRLPFRMFGPAVPPGALLGAVGRTGPAAVLLWSQARQTADPVLAGRAAETAWGGRGSRSRPVVLPAGPGWTDSRCPPGLPRPRDLAGALDRIERLLTD
ncbi:MerR family transcriptional regulator [Kitasatospora sp. NBC_00240]|uniref:MerR family transcriptional regulator n=1 Tax=Kitasatospora sp. NBC_00240 TaxID=2903567 RepID=UPI002257CCFB|nr:MerR family transcriptional regulator [Kitasatospora sp. NBC_00240]MCX5215085.1 MerR family transcriptional regulator [Kitasatospora sp. NBC_00240]